MRKPCRKCLLAQTDLSDVLAEIKDLISLIPPEKRASEEVYSGRLNICSECENLTDGTCTECGCFVELRAAKNNLGCPDACDRWKEIV